MKKKVLVLSLGGSLIIPDGIDTKFIREFKKVILKNKKKYKFVIVCGGGSVARKYISALEALKVNEKFQGFSGISATRMNARFMTYSFGEDANKGVPHDMKDVKNLLKIYDVVFCGALRYAKNETSDGTSAKLANYFRTIFINFTNVTGLYNKNPKKYKNTRLIREISWRDFNKMANKNKFKPGQHFVLDQTASKIILKNKIPTYIIGSAKQLDNLLKEKKFIGTIIEG